MRNIMSYVLTTLLTTGSLEKFNFRNCTYTRPTLSVRRSLTSVTALILNFSVSGWANSDVSACNPPNSRKRFCAYGNCLIRDDRAYRMRFLTDDSVRVDRSGTRCCKAPASTTTTWTRGLLKGNGNITLYEAAWTQLSSYKTKPREASNLMRFW